MSEHKLLVDDLKSKNSGGVDEKQIDEMARVIELTNQIARDAHCGLPSPRMYAKDLYWHGCRKQSEEGAECPTCHGTGRIGTTDWLTKGLSKKQIAEEKSKAIAEHEQYIKTEVAREIFEEIDSKIIAEIDLSNAVLIEFEGAEEIYNRIKGEVSALCKLRDFIAELKKKYTEGGGLNEIHALRTPASRY